MPCFRSNQFYLFRLLATRFSSQSAEELYANFSVFIVWQIGFVSVCPLLITTEYAVLFVHIMKQIVENSKKCMKVTHTKRLIAKPHKRKIVITLLFFFSPYSLSIPSGMAWHGLSCHSCNLLFDDANAITLIFSTCWMCLLESNNFCVTALNLQWVAADLAHTNAVH